MRYLSWTSPSKRAQVYEALPRTEHSFEHEKVVPDIDPRPLPRDSHHILQWSSLAITLLLCTNLFTVTLLLVVWGRLFQAVGPIRQPASDKLFGHLPTSAIAWHSDEAYTSTDPYTGAFWNNGTGPKGSTPWDELFRSGWIAVEEPQAHGLSGGVPLKHFAHPEYKDFWPDSAEAYNPAVLHQLHCIGSLKHLIESTKPDDIGHDESAKAQFEHLFHHGEHCIEYLRHSIMCAADLTLEPAQLIDLTSNEIRGTTGWDTKHVCRDWHVVHEKLWSRLVKIFRIDGRWAVVPDYVVHK